MNETVVVTADSRDVWKLGWIRKLSDQIEMPLADLILSDTVVHGIPLEK